MNYIGEQCFGCGRKFDENDDVVVCPDCGTPYHRECYKQAGECLNRELHESGEGWKRKGDGQADAVKEKICPRCQQKNSADAEKCSSCGESFVQRESSQEERISPEEMAELFSQMDVNKECLGFDPEEEFDGVKLRDISSFVNSNTMYYIPLFKRMKAFGSKISFNAACLFFPYFYFANRKMWGWAVVTALITLVFDIPAMLYIIGQQGEFLPYMSEISSFIISNEKLLLNLSEALNGIGWVIRLLLCLFGNWLYFRFVIRSVRKIRRSPSGQRIGNSTLRAKGGVQPVNILIIGIILMAMTMAAYFVLMFILMFVQQLGVI